MTAVVMVLERTTAPRAEPAWVAAVEVATAKRGWRFKLVDAAERWPDGTGDLGPIEDVDAVVWFVRSARLFAAAPFDWGGFSGARILLDHDALKNWGWQGSTQYVGAWDAVLKRGGFDLIITSSGTAAERFNNAGFTAEWLPKSVDAKQFRDLGHARRGTGHFGTLYPARQAMLAITTRAGVAVEHVQVPYLQLNDALNRFESCVVCNLDGRSNRWLRRLLPTRPELWFSAKPGIEVMYKNFEIAASGAALVCDRVADLASLGFVDGRSMLAYESFDELVDQLRGLSPERARDLGAAGASLVRERHTHAQRASDFVDLVERVLSPP